MTIVNKFSNYCVEDKPLIEDTVSSSSIKENLETLLKTVD